MQYLTILILYIKSIALTIQVIYIVVEVIELKKRITFTLDEKLVEQLKKVSEETMIPQARLVEQAIREVIKKYGK